MLRSLQASQRWSRLVLLHQRQIRHVVNPSRILASSSTNNTANGRRFYSPSLKRMDEADAAEAKQEETEEEKAAKAEKLAQILATKAERIEKKLSARDYNSRRAAYNRQVSLLRKQYADEVARQRAADEAARLAEEQELTRRRLERQRRKNIRSAQNAIREKEKREQRAREFEEHLAVQQKLREQRNARYNRARQMVIDELEAEAHLWLTTPEEVEAAFTEEAEQLLWTRPNGVLGAPSPSLDSHYWQYSSHTYVLDKTYKTQKELLLEDLLEDSYEQSTVDESFWTPERLEEREALEIKARLRAMVRAEGRKSLLARQKEMIETQYGTTDDQIPKKMPVPNVTLLANYEAQEREGAKILFNDPTKFFKFDNESEGSDAGEGEDDNAAYSGPSLGAPIGLRDPLRDHQWDGVFPIGVGKLPKADNRTEREKKRQEREQKLWEAAQAESSAEAGEVDTAAEEEVFSGVETVDYDADGWDSDDDEWAQGLDPDNSAEDAEALATPKELRYSDDDLKWVIERLEQKMEYLQLQIERDIESAKQSLRTQRDSRRERKSLEGGAPDDDEGQDELEALMISLTNEQILALVDIESSDLSAMSPEEVSDALSKVPGLSEDEVKRILELDDSKIHGSSGNDPDSGDT